MEVILAQLAEMADIVVLNGPPITAAVDASILATQVDGVLLVLAAGRTKRALAKRAMTMLQQVSANLLGTVLTDVPPQQVAYASGSAYRVHAKHMHDFVAGHKSSAFSGNGAAMRQPVATPNGASYE